MNYKDIGILAAICLVSVGVSLDFVFAEDNTSGWQTCVNSKEGFEVSYPADWIKDDSSLFPNYIKEAVKLSASCTFFIPKTKTMPEDIWISVSTKSCQSLSCDPREEMPEPYNKTVKQATIEGKQIFVYDDAFEAERSLSYILVNESKTLEASLTLDVNHGRQTGTEYLSDEEIESELQILQQMLSTFKFTGTVNDWQTYTNTTYGFEAKYPADFIPTIDKYNAGMFWLQSKSNTADIEPFIIVSHEPYALLFAGTWSPVARSQMEKILPALFHQDP